MDLFDSNQFWLVLLAAVASAFLIGRAVRRHGDGEDAAAKRLRRDMQAHETFAILSAEKQEKVDALVAENRVIEAVKLVREETGMGLREAKDAVDARRRALKGER